MRNETEQTVRIWRTEEMFRPRPLPEPSARNHVTDVSTGEPLPWESSASGAGAAGAGAAGAGASGAGAAGTGASGADASGTEKAWRHQVFGGLFPLSRVRGSLAGESALFTCTVSESGELIDGPAVSECAWAVGQAALGDQAAGGGDPTAWLSGSSADGYLSVSRDNLPELPDGPLTSTALTQFAAELSDLLGVTALLQPCGLRVRDCPPASSVANGSAPGSVTLHPLGGHFAADLARIAGALREPEAGPPLSSFLAPPEDEGRVDVRAHPLITRNGCDPGRTPRARWPSDDPLALSEQFAVNEILASDAALAAVHTPPGAAASGVFGDLAAAIVVARAEVLAGLLSPDVAFGATPAIWGTHVVLPPATALTGFEIVLATADPDAPGFAPVAARWADRATETAYLGSTARLHDAESRRFFADRFWHGSVRGTEALFRAGEPLRSVLEDPPPVDWPAAVGAFRSALARVQSLSSERSEAASALARFSALEEACDDAYASRDAARASIAELSAREPPARATVEAAEERRRVALADLEAHRDDKPGVVVAVSTGLRAGRDWYETHGTLRASFEAAVRARDEALSALQSLRASMAQARETVATSEAAVARFTTEMEQVHAFVATARRRWGQYVPEGPAYAETEDAALIELRENSAPWADEEFAEARAELFFAALDLHKALILANAGTFRANLDAWMDLVSGSADAGLPDGAPPEVALAAWQTFFLVVPVVSTTFESLGSLLPGLGRGSLGWFLAAGCEQVPPRHVAGALWRANRAVLAGTSGESPDASAPAASSEAGAPTAQSYAARTSRFGTWLPDGSWSGLPLYPLQSRDDRTRSTEVNPTRSCSSRTDGPNVSSTRSVYSSRSSAAR